MFNHSQMNDNMIKQNTDVPYNAKEEKHALEDQNTIVVTNKKGLKYRLKKIFKRKKDTN